MVTDLVLCTDIASKERRELGMEKWKQACVANKRRMQQRSSLSTVVTNNTSGGKGGGLLKLYTPEAARAISEQLMQAADVSHTMQHFSTFAKWNCHLYHEVLAAYQCGRTKSVGTSTIKHPKENWYASQIGFFDHYVIPLAERLDACGAFSEEHKFAPLAVQNKEQWIVDGEECTRAMVLEAEGMELRPPMPIAPVIKESFSAEESGGGEMDGSNRGGRLDGSDREKGILSMSLTTVVAGQAYKRNNRGEVEEICSILDEMDVDSTNAIDENEQDHNMDDYDHLDSDDFSLDSIPNSVETSRVSFAARSVTSRGSRRSTSQWVSSSSDVDSSVNAIVPNVLVRQLIDSMQKDVRGIPPDLRMSALRKSFLKYQTNGSICRHHGALLFVDISGFTALSQNYPVEDFKTFINQYFTKIIDLVICFGGEVVKFAGDALYAIWTSGLNDTNDIAGVHTRQSAESNNSEGDSGDSGSEATQMNKDSSPFHGINIEKCTLCAIAINATCNNYKVFKSYKRRSDVSIDPSSRRGSTFSASEDSGRSQGEVLYTYQDRNAEYEQRDSVLNVYCGVSEGVMAGVDVVANNRGEFFLIGTPLKDVAKAESLAGPGELVVSPSVYDSLQKRGVIMSKLLFTHVESDYQRVTWANQQSSVNEMLSLLEGQGSISNNKTDAESLIDELVHSAHSSIPLEISESLSDPSSETTLQSDLMHLLEYHRHEAARDVVGKFTAELRRVVVIFISIMYEPSLPEDPSDDDVLLENFQSIYSIISESVSSRSGQVRQFINDDKGTVFIGSFGLRGSVILHPSDAAVEAAQEAQKKLFEIMDIKCSIGITLGNIFCGETGSFQRYEYSMLGPSVNLSARLMAKGAWGEVNCDEELKNHTGQRLTFTISGTYKLKGYEEPVPFFMPAQDYWENKDGEEDDVVTFFMQRDEVLGLVDNILNKREADIRGSGNSSASQKIKPRIILIKGSEGKGKDAFISGILKQPDLWDTSVIMEANRCFHDDPFYCFIPIITHILLSFSESRDRLRSLKKRHKRSSILSSFLANPAFKIKAFPRGTNMVPSMLKPYLSLVNDFVFKGFPLLKSCAETKRLKDNEKVEKCVEVIAALISQYLELMEKPGIISICEIDSIDNYSNKLLRRIMRSDANLLVIGGADDSSLPVDDENTSVGDARDGIRTVILGKESYAEMEIKHLELLDQKNTFDLFLWCLRRDFPLDECKEMIDHPDVHDKIFQLCGGMTHATSRLAHTFCTQFQKELQNNKAEDIEAKGTIDCLDFLQSFLNDTPTDFEEITCFRMDQMKPEEQMLLKVASVAGFDQYSFSQNLLESVLLALSRSESSDVTKDYEDKGSGNIGDNMEFQVPISVGGDVPNSVGVSGENKFSYMFQGDYFERTLDSLVAHKFLDEVNVEMSDLSSMDSVMYRFRNQHEQSVINGLMLNDQKKRTHFEVATFYSSSFHRGGDSSLGENDSSSLSTDITSVPSTNWELFHIIALHYDLAYVPIPAMLHYYDSSASLASLGVRDKAHGRLLSAYLMLEKILHHASTLDIKLDEAKEQRRQIAGQMVRTIGNEDLKESMKILTKDHLRLAFDGDIFAFKKCLEMLTKFGQSVGTIEEEGYLFGSEVYLQAILLLLLVAEDEAFANLTLSLGSFLGQLDNSCMKDEAEEDFLSENGSLSSENSSVEEMFDIDDLTISFPAFSGLLTFYRDSPIGANEVQETFLANLFVAVTQEANQMIHVLRTKCILSHLYLKHGNIAKALEECEGIKDIYDHDAHSLELANVYGMDWSLICVATMASTYLFKGQFAAARQNIDFLKTQMLKLDEFASSTKAMSKGTISSFYLLLHEFENAAEIANGINTTQYGYFFKPIGTLQEELANRELALNQHKIFDSSERDLDLLSILSSDNVHEINHNRGMFPQSAETLSDRGIEAVRAALCSTEIRNLELQSNHNADTVRKQIQYCQAGLAHLNQSLGQKDANNHERLKNHMMCLYQRCHLLCWHHKLFLLLQDNFEDGEINDTLEIRGTEIDSARKSLEECRELSETHQYPFMQLLVGKSLIKLGFDISGGEELIQHALQCIEPSDSEVAKSILSRMDDVQGNVGSHTINLFRPTSLQRGMPSAA